MSVRRMGEPRILPRPLVEKLDEWDTDLLAVLDWLYGKDGEPDLVERVELRGRELGTGWSDTGVLAALREELGMS